MDFTFELITWLLVLAIGAGLQYTGSNHRRRDEFAKWRQRQRGYETHPDGYYDQSAFK